MFYLSLSMHVGNFEPQNVKYSGQFPTKYVKGFGCIGISTSISRIVKLTFYRESTYISPWVMYILGIIVKAFKMVTYKVSSKGLYIM